MKPNLFIVGAPKCGTTAWAEYLSAHPNVSFSVIKEPHFFSTDLPKIAAVKDLNEYMGLFAKSESTRVAGEASVGYLYSEEAARNIYEFNPDSKIMIFVRDQEDCLPSAHNQMLYNFKERIEDFETAWRLSGMRTADTIGETCTYEKQLDYKDRGRFWKHAMRFIDQFGSDQIRILHYRDWVSDPRAYYLEVLNFLDLDDDGRTDFSRVNAGAHHKNVHIARLLQSPPRPITRTVEYLHKLTGKRSFGLARALGQLNQDRGYLKAMRIREELRQEIRDFYEEENTLLEPWIFRVGM